MSTFDIKKFLIKEGMTRVSRDRKRLSEEIKEDENVVTVRAGHQLEDVWGRGMTPEEVADFYDPKEMYLDGDIESWDEIKPGKYYVWSDGVSAEDETEAYFGNDVNNIPWDYIFAVMSRHNPYDTEEFRLRCLEDLDESKH